MALIRFILPVATAFGLTLATLPAHADIILYSDDFSGNNTTNLNGSTPDTTTGANIWTAATGWKDDGSIAATGGLDADAAFLAFTPTAGNIYTLSATLARPTGGGGGTARWAALGFTASNDTTIFWQAPNNAMAWMLYRANNGVINTYTGPGVTSPGGETTVYNGVQTMTIVLDTTGANWTAEWFVGPTSIRGAGGTVTYATPPTITHIGLGRSGGPAADFSVLSLTVVPEPSTVLLGGLGALVLLRRRRRN